MINFVDLKVQYYSIKDEIDNAIASVIEDTAFIRGRYVESFEKAYAKEYNVRHCISVANGTDAIYIALKALGIGLGDEVITTTSSWIATSEVITQSGAKVVFVDIEPDYYSIDVSKIEEKITPRTKAIIPVHLYGQPVDMNNLLVLCKKRNLYLIEDCAQAHFAEYKGQKVGTFGDVGTFSFYPGKNLGAYGDAGAVITNNDELAIKMRMFANHGALTKHESKIEGINSRLDGLQAAILSVKLAYIEEWNRKRQKNANLYSELLEDIDGIITPKIRTNVQHVFHLYVIRYKKRNELQKYLKEKDISTAIHYPKALPFMEAYKYLNHKPDDFPIAYQYQDEIISLPLYPELSERDIRNVVNNIKNFITYNN